MNLNFVVFAAFYAVWSQRRRFVMTLAWPFTAYLVFDVSVVFLPGQMILSWLALLTDLFLSTIVAVTTHRLVLLGGQSVGRWGVTRWTLRETRFFAYSLCFVVVLFFAGPIVTAPILGIGLPLPIAFGVAAIGALYLLTRWILVLPAIAVGDDVSLGRAWRLSSRSPGKLLLICVAFPLLAAVPLLIAGFLPIWPGLVLGVVFSNLMLIFSISAISMAYRELTKETA